MAHVILCTFAALLPDVAAIVTAGVLGVFMFFANITMPPLFGPIETREARLTKAAKAYGTMALCWLYAGMLSVRYILSQPEPTGILPVAAACIIIYALFGITSNQTAKRAKVKPKG